MVLNSYVNCLIGFIFRQSIMDQTFPLIYWEAPNAKDMAMFKVHGKLWMHLPDDLLRFFPAKENDTFFWFAMKSLLFMVPSMFKFTLRLLSPRATQNRLSSMFVSYHWIPGDLHVDKYAMRSLLQASDFKFPWRKLPEMQTNELIHKIVHKSYVYGILTVLTGLTSTSSL